MVNVVMQSIVILSVVILIAKCHHCQSSLILTCLLSKAMAVILSVETKIEVAWSKAATGQATG